MKLFSNIVGLIRLISEKRKTSKRKQELLKKPPPPIRRD